MAILRVRLFGGLVVSWGENPLPPIAGAVARSLFAYLLTYRDRRHTRGLLAGTFWPDFPDDLARRRLSQALWQIRKALDPHPVLLIQGDTVQINPGLPLWLDVEEFARHRAQCAREGTAEESSTIEHCELCLEQYKGDFLAGYYDDWLFPERERLRDQLLNVLERLVAGYKRQGDDTAALAHARRLAAEDPLREEAHHEVMRLCHLLGRDVEALQQFETCRQVLAEELGVEPSPETAALAQEIAAHGGQGARLILPQVPPLPAAFVLDSAEGPELPLVGREAERTELLTHVEALFQNLGGAVLLEGEAGVGKTRLLQAIAGDAEWRGAEVLWGKTRELEASMPYGPLVEALSGGLSPLRAKQLPQVVEVIWLQVLTALLPPLVAGLPDLRPPPVLEPAQERERLVNALAQLLAGWAQIVPLLLIIEDLHWAREDSLDLLARLVPLLSQRGVLVLGSYRGEDARAVPETWQKLQALDRVGVRQRLVLNRLDAASAGELVRRSLGLGSPAPLFEARLFEETEGNPLFLLETLRALHGEGLLFRDEKGQWSTPWDERTSDYAELPLPPAVEQIIARRLVVLTPSLRGTIQLASVLGERFDFDLLHAASSEQPSGLLASLRGLIQRRFLDETEQDYRFHHDKIRRVVYDTIDAAGRPRLHRRVAQALESLQPGRVAALAHHWTEAEVWEESAIYHRQAGDRAREVYANVEAAHHYTQALQALERLPGSPDLVRTLELRLAREAVNHLLGERAAQAEDLAALEELLRDPRLDGSDLRLGVMLRRAAFWEVTGDYPAALAVVQEAAKQAQATGNAQAEYQAHLNWGRILLWQGKLVAARKHIEQAYVLAQASQNLSAQAATLNELASLAAEVADYEARMNYYRRALVVCQQSGDQAVQARIYNGMANLLHELADYAAAVEHHQRALAPRRGPRRPPPAR